MHYEGDQDRPCDRTQERREQNEQLICHQRQETEEENLNNSFAIEHGRGPATARGSLAKAREVVSSAAPAGPDAGGGLRIGSRVASATGARSQVPSSAAVPGTGQPRRVSTKGAFYDWESAGEEF